MNRTDTLIRMSLAIATCLLLPWGTAEGLLCVADCDASGGVAVNEIVSATQIALGLASLQHCPSADADNSGTVTVDEILSSVGGAIEGCTAVRASVSVAAALALARLMTHVHSLSRAVAVAFDGSDRDEECVYGGTLDNMCEESGVGNVRVSVNANACRVESLEGDAVYQGPVRMIGPGRCPDIVVPANLLFDFDWTGSTEFEDGSPQLELRWLGTLFLETFALGPPPCSVKGATSVLNEELRFATPDEASLGVHASDLRIAVEFKDLLPDFACEPQEVAAVVDGAVRLEDSFPTGLQVAELNLHGLRSELSRSTRLLDIDGFATGAELGGRALVHTAEPLRSPLGRGCFDAGVLEIGIPAGTTQLRFGPGEQMHVDFNGDGSIDEIYSSCGDRPVSDEGGS